jgi:hypothetical protein
MKLMSTYGAQVEMDGGSTQRSVSAENGRAKVKKTFKYIEPFYNHFKFWHQAYDRNNQHHSPISLEESLSTKDWNIRVFLFIIALVEVNARLAWSHFSDMPPITQLEFRRLLAKDCKHAGEGGRLITSNVDRSVVKKLRQSLLDTGLVRNGQNWRQRTRSVSARTLNGNKRIRTYCRCKVSNWMCSICIPRHIVSRDNERGVED